jgi:hypothetical protein
VNIYGSLMYAHDFHFFVTHDEPLPEPNPPGETPAYQEPMLDWGGAYASSWLQCLARPQEEEGRKLGRTTGGPDAQQLHLLAGTSLASNGFMLNNGPRTSNGRMMTSNGLASHGLLILNGLASTGVIRGGLGLSNAMVGSRNQAVPDFV